LTFLIGSVLAAVGGILFGMYTGRIWFFDGFLVGLKAFTAAVLGGIGNIGGAVMGGFLIGVVEALVSGFVPQGGQWRDVVVFLILVGVLVFRPTGLLGERVGEGDSTRRECGRGGDVRRAARRCPAPSSRPLSPPRSFWPGSLSTPAGR